MPSLCRWWLRLVGLACALGTLALLSMPAASASAHGEGEVHVTSRIAQRHGLRVKVVSHGDRGIPAGSDREMRRRARRAALRSLRPEGLLARAATASPTLAPTWCGNETSVDDTVDAAASAGARYKVVYAYALDQPDRFSQYADLIQGDMRTLNDVIVAASAGSEGIRFDVGTVCGPSYVDIVSVRLAHTRGQLLAAGFSSRVAMIRNDIDAAYGALQLGSGINELIYADGLYAGDGIAGVGSMYDSDVAGASNPANLGGLTAIVFGDGSAAFTPGTRRQNTALHELSHNLGAVQDSAPHSTLAGHCTDLDDVMCYADGGPHNVLTHPCADAPLSPYDCGADDYFNPSPAAGSYLATHWNVASSRFLCPVGGCIRDGNGNTPPTPQISILAGGVPVSSVAPGTTVALDGSASSDPQGPIASWTWQVGGPLTATRTGETTSVTLAGPGTYIVRLTVTDGDGAPASATSVLVVPAATNAPSNVKGAASSTVRRITRKATKRLTAAQKRRAAARRRALARKKAAAKRRVAQRRAAALRR